MSVLHTHFIFISAYGGLEKKYGMCKCRGKIEIGGNAEFLLFRDTTKAEGPEVAVATGIRCAWINFRYRSRSDKKGLSRKLKGKCRVLV